MYSVSGAEDLEGREELLVVRRGADAVLLGLQDERGVRTFLAFRNGDVVQSLSSPRR